MDLGNDITSSNSSSTISDFSTGKETEDNNSESNQPPKKKMYKRVLHHGFRKFHAHYHKLTRKTDESRQSGVVCTSSIGSQFFDKMVTVNKNPVLENNDFEGCSSFLFSDSDTDGNTTSDIDSETSDSQLSEDKSSFAGFSESESDFGDLTSLSETDLEDDKIYELNNRIFENSKHTIYSSYTAILLFVMKHSLSNDAFSDLLELIESHLPVPSSFSTSVYRVKETLKQSTGFQEPCIHFYCEGCQEILHENEPCGKVSCRRHNSKVKEYHDLRIVDQLKSLFRDENFVKLVEENQRHTESEYINDIYDGKIYQTFRGEIEASSAMKADINLTFIMNTDGVSLFQSSKKGTLWPVYLAINELPIKLRFFC